MDNSKYRNKNRNRDNNKTKEMESSHNIKILQINLNRCRLAQDIMDRTTDEEEIDVVIVSEPYKTPSNWFRQRRAGCDLDHRKGKQ
ncbi:hypothetical protein WN55_07674 [Dufourea novaeangliae]|uniref:Uncharacterized protein n=1 Tax=Dufourea novaeangliae TaxID=178035 RepID=A0A154P5Y6_DUFNO|nr:hypothetical protein WN55_07674 [Dufourea novaeangliae]